MRKIRKQRWFIACIILILIIMGGLIYLYNKTAATDGTFVSVKESSCRINENEGEVVI